MESEMSAAELAELQKRVRMIEVEVAQMAAAIARLHRKEARPAGTMAAAGRLDGFPALISPRASCCAWERVSVPWPKQYPGDRVVPTSAFEKSCHGSGHAGVAVFCAGFQPPAMTVSPRAAATGG
jgi:hypothetical protein